MPDSDGDHSVTAWVSSLKAGDPVAAENLWKRYFERLVQLAAARLRRSRRTVADEEDAALSAFDSFCRGAARGRYPRLDDRNDLWRLLVVITERKAIDQAQNERRQKRGGGKNGGTPARVDADGDTEACLAVVGSEPTPEFAVMAADECARLFGCLRDETLRQIARLRMEGYTNDEISERLGCSLRTVARKVELIRKTWLETAPRHS
jgi:DNA-directed RNA polymerase specialized sigma24 family protein